jgi:hypothetical protein
MTADNIFHSIKSYEIKVDPNAVVGIEKELFDNHFFIDRGVDSKSGDKFIKIGATQYRDGVADACNIGMVVVDYKNKKAELKIKDADNLLLINPCALEQIKEKCSLE